MLTSGQDRGVGRHALPPCTTTRRITTNLQTNNTQNYQKIELYGSLKTKLNVEKPNSSRQVGGVETQSQVGEARRCSVAQRGGSGGTGGPTSMCGA